jgi:hypothetical protein
MIIHTERYWRPRPVKKSGTQLELNLGKILEKQITPILENIKKSEIIKTKEIQKNG